MAAVTAAALVRRKWTRLQFLWIPESSSLLACILSTRIQLTVQAVWTAKQLAWRAGSAMHWLFAAPWTVGSPPGCSVHGNFQARILECIAAPFSRESSQPWDWTWKKERKRERKRERTRGREGERERGREGGKKLCTLPENSIIKSWQNNTYVSLWACVHAC